MPHRSCARWASLPPPTALGGSQIAAASPAVTGLWARCHRSRPLSGTPFSTSRNRVKEPAIPRRDDFRQRSHPAGKAPPPITVGLDRAIIQRWGRRNAERRLTRLLRPRNRRALAERLRRTANNPTNRRPARRGRGALVHDRAAAVRTELLEIPALLDRAPALGPASVGEIGQLLADGDSPLSHPAIHISELHA